LRGYALLLPDPVPASLNDLDPAARARFLLDMTIIGDAQLEVTGAWRINYEILGNSEPALHAHILPRFAWEEESARRRPAWFYDWKSAPPFDAERDKPLMEDLANAIQKRLQAEAS
jgi:diadenosine tetraphosphate (Ap4A) HIT family hydrolase